MKIHLTSQKLLFAFAGVLLICSCNPGSSGPADDPQAGQYIRCNINGIPWEATNDSLGAALSGSAGYPLAGVVGGYSTGFSMHIFIEYPVAPDTSVNVTQVTHSLIRYYTPTGIYGCDNGQTTIHHEAGSLPYVTELWTGTFSGTFVKLLVSNPDTILITNGEFEGHEL